MPSAKPLIINTGPLLALFAATGDLRALRRIRSRVIVPFEVEREVLAGGANNFAVDLYRHEEWLERRAAETSMIPLIANSIDPGEAAVISLALREGITDVCLDDKEARHVARLSGLNVTGSLGILLAARASGESINLREAVEAMRQRGIWISDELTRKVLRLAGE